MVLDGDAPGIDSSAASMAMTQTGQVVLSPGYTCPQSIMLLTFDSRSEVYSFGVLVCEVLSGSVQELVPAKRSFLHTPTSAATLTPDPRAGDWPEGLTAKLRGLAQWCLSPWEARPETMAAVLRDLIGMQKEFCVTSLKDARVQAEMIVLRETVERIRQADALLRHEALSEPNMTCLLCLCEYRKKEGVECSSDAEKHFYCRECFANSVTAQSEPEFRLHLVEHDSHVVCTMCLHSNPPEVTRFRLETVVSVCPEPVVEKFLAAGKEIVEVKTYDAQQLKYEKQLAALKVELAKCSENKQQALGQHRIHILENILNLRCPRATCKKVFADFDGCFAVTCHSCRCGFCGW